MNLADLAANAYLGQGWYPPENIGGVMGRWSGTTGDSVWRFDLAPQTYELTFQAVPFPANQELTVAVNQVEIERWVMPGAWYTFTATIPAELITPGEPTYITLHHSQMLSVYEQSEGQSPDTRPLGAAYAWIDLQPFAK